jgi:hypothetical protein
MILTLTCIFINTEISFLLDIIIVGEVLHSIRHKSIEDSLIMQYNYSTFSTQSQIFFSGTNAHSNKCFFFSFSYGYLIGKCGDIFDLPILILKPLSRALIKELKVLNLTSILSNILQNI